MRQVDAGVLNVGYAEAGPTDGPAARAFFSPDGQFIYASVSKNNGDVVIYDGLI